MVPDTDPVEPSVLDQLTQCSPAAIADTKHESVTVLSSTLQPTHSDCTFAGTARTVTLDPNALWAPVQTLDAAVADEVIVVDATASVDEAIWGELLSQYATEVGLRGLVTNGAVRDVSGIRDIGFPVFARAVTPQGPSGETEREHNVEVTVGDATIAPGDVLVGDESGVVVIARDAVTEVADAAAGIVQTERDVEQLISDGYSLGDAFDAAGMT